VTHANATSLVLDKVKGNGISSSAVKTEEAMGLSRNTVSAVFLAGVDREGLTIWGVTNAEPSQGGRSKIRRSPGVILRLKALVKIYSIGNGPRLTMSNNQKLTRPRARNRSLTNAREYHNAQSRSFRNVTGGQNRRKNIGVENYLLYMKSSAGKDIFAR
jgi:hypothetical protein